MQRLSRRSRGSRRQRGLSLVETMIGITVGLFVVAAAAMLVSSQLSGNRRLLLETQVHQDLRATADIITRELRRAGRTGTAQQVVWNADTGPLNENPYLSVTGGAGSTVGFNYKRDNTSDGPFGFSLDNGVVRTVLTGGAVQDLTDKNVLVVDALTFATISSALVKLPCPKPCPPVGGQPPNYCYPTIGVRSLQVTITGHAKSDDQVRRTVTSLVRLRNDDLRFHTGTANACPL